MIFDVVLSEYSVSSIQIQQDHVNSIPWSSLIDRKIGFEFFSLGLTWYFLPLLVGLIPRMTWGDFGGENKDAIKYIPTLSKIPNKINKKIINTTFEIVLFASANSLILFELDWYPEKMLPKREDDEFDDDEDWSLKFRLGG